jgi:two-component system chemotaxis response regulator CheB
MSKPKIRVLVVEDSLTIRRHLCEVLARDEELEIVGEAEDGRRAIELCEALRPDVITMDMMLPVMTGLSATEFIMAHRPTPILVVSASTNRGELFKTYDALAAGAVDVMEKPLGDDSDPDWERRLVQNVKLVARIRVITHPRARLGTLGRPSTPALPAAAPARAAGAPAVIGIGASTGGPSAILAVLSALPRDYPIPILFVLHIGEQFAAAFAEWLDSQCPLSVLYAENGMPLAPGGRVLVAPPGRHLVVRDRRLRLDSGPERHSCRPSVDVLFESLAEEYPGRAAGCLLTGMGADGAAGLGLLRRTGALTIAQDEATSTVYGMPREAARLGAAERILPLGAIGPALAALALEQS